ncbi:MAG: ATP synthase F1 subunit delta [Capnocytophaga sp.]|nr:ATP synthase F1 subunit delta [Capnocytophaga sp.]
MQSVKVPKRYAKALLSFAIEKHQADILFDEIQSLVNVIHENTELRSLLRSPVVKSEIKKNILNDIFPEKSEVLERFFLILTQNKRMSSTYAIAKEFILQYNIYKDKETAVVTTAQPISQVLQDKFLAKIQQLTGKTNISLKNKVDENIIGGFILRIGDLQYNASISNKLNTIRSNFQENIFI